MAFLGVPVGQHLTNLMDLIQSKNPGGRFALQLSELRSAIKAANSRTEQK
jgi:hypothetical protein